MNSEQRGIILVLSGPAGSGKSTVVGELMKSGKFDYSVSATTRTPRPGEVDGESYYFVTREKFLSMVAEGKMLEHAEYCGNFYGTPVDPVDKSLAAGRCIISEIETVGAAQIKKLRPKDAVLVFLTPESASALENRLRGRGTESEGSVHDRLEKAKSEIEKFFDYDYSVVNRLGGTAEAARQILGIVEAELHRTSRRGYIYNQFFK